MGVDARAGECSEVRDLGDTMNCWAGHGQMERDLGGGPKIALLVHLGESSHFSSRICFGNGPGEVSTEAESQSQLFF